MANDYYGAYFDRLCNVVRSAHGPDPMRYYNVLWHLHTTEFVPTLALDRNRVKDAMDFRYGFVHDPTEPVGIFELMVSLANRIEVEIMSGTEDRNRTAEWFWKMFESLGLLDMTDEEYDERSVDRTIRKFICRQYLPNGKGGLFTISDRSVDMRGFEIWYQAALYLNDVLRSEGVLEP